jgi:hypothetical protein
VTTLAPANPLRGLSFDSDYVKTFVAAIDGPVVLVEHSYGGAVITQASAGLDNVIGLIYPAAWGLDEGETFLETQAPHPPSLLASTSLPTDYPAGSGATAGPDLYIGELHPGPHLELGEDGPQVGADGVGGHVESLVWGGGQ